jgi:hypothetical protein
MDAVSPSATDQPGPSDPTSHQSIFLPPQGEEILRRSTMCTVGVDLSASPERTACAAIEWEGDEALIALPLHGIGRDDLNAYLARGDWIGVGAPFGWPAPMVAALSAYCGEKPWPELDNESFRTRRTDRHLQSTVRAETAIKFSPMSASASGVAVTACRAAQLREDGYRISGRRFDRAGADQVLEVSCTAALIIWGLEHKGYKSGGRIAAERPEAASARASLIEALEAQAPWLRWADGAREACLESDDPLDAVIAALIARAVAVELAYPLRDEDRDLARREGWAHLPLKGSLPRLRPDRLHGDDLSAHARSGL